MLKPDHMFLKTFVVRFPKTGFRNSCRHPALFTQNIYDLARHILQDLEGVGDEADDEQNPDDRSRRSVGRLFS